MNLWLVFFVCLVVLVQVAIESWIFIAKRKIFRLFCLNEDRWWFAYSLKTETSAPLFIISRVLREMQRELGLEIKIIPIRGMEQLINDRLVPVLQVGYRLGEPPGGSHLKRSFAPGELTWS